MTTLTEIQPETPILPETLSPAPKELWQLRQTLAQRIAEQATVRNPETGFVFCPEVNQTVSPELLWQAAQIVRGLFVANLPPHLRPHKVVGIANKGKEFAAALGLALNLPIAVTDRKPSQPDATIVAHYDSSHDQTVITGIPSFTKRIPYTHLLFGVRPGERLLFADDFCARGSVALALAEALDPLEITSVFAFLVAKDFPHLNPPQIGYRLLKQKEIPAFAVVRFTAIQNGRVVAVAEDI